MTNCARVLFEFRLEDEATANPSPKIATEVLNEVVSLTKDKKSSMRLTLKYSKEMNSNKLANLKSLSESELRGKFKPN